MCHPPSVTRILSIADSRAGVANQATALADALARLVPGAEREHATVPRRALFAPELPAADIVIGCAGPSTPALRKAGRAGAKTVFVQDPRRGYGQFDLVVAPEHDRVEASNAIAMIGSPSPVSPDRLLEAERVEAPSPVVAFLIGGPSKRHRFDAATQARILDAVRSVSGTALVTTSRRTPPELVEALRETDATLHTGDGPNPYLAWLAGADAVAVTEDSTNMLVDACATGVPVFRLPVAGEAGKLDQLYARLAERCGVRRWDGNLSAEPYAPLEETARAAREIALRLGLATHPTPR